MDPAGGGLLSGICQDERNPCRPNDGPVYSGESSAGERKAEALEGIKKPGRVRLSSWRTCAGKPFVLFRQNSLLHGLAEDMESIPDRELARQHPVWNALQDVFERPHFLLREIVCYSNSSCLQNPVGRDMTVLHSINPTCCCIRRIDWAQYPARLADIQKLAFLIQVLINVVTYLGVFAYPPIRTNLRTQSPVGRAAL